MANRKTILFTWKYMTHLGLTDLQKGQLTTGLVTAQARVVMGRIMAMETKAATVMEAMQVTTHIHNHTVSLTDKAPSLNLIILTRTTIVLKTRGIDHKNLLMVAKIQVMEPVALILLKAMALKLRNLVM